MESGNHFSQDESEILTSCGPANNATLSNLELALIKRKGKVATVPQGMTLHGEARGSARDAADAAERARGAGRWPALEPGSGPVGKGEICLRDSPRRARRRMRLASLWRDPAVAETVSGPPCDSSRRFGGVPGILQRAK